MVIAVAVADAGREAPRSLGNIENTKEDILKLMKIMDYSTDLEVFYTAVN